MDEEGLEGLERARGHDGRSAADEADREGGIDLMKKLTQRGRHPCAMTWSRGCFQWQVGRGRQIYRHAFGRRGNYRGDDYGLGEMGDFRAVFSGGSSCWPWAKLTGKCRRIRGSRRSSRGDAGSMGRMIAM